MTRCWRGLTQGQTLKGKNEASECGNSMQTLEGGPQPGWRVQCQYCDPSSPFQSYVLQLGKTGGWQVPPALSTPLRQTAAAWRLTGPLCQVDGTVTWIGRPRLKAFMGSESSLTSCDLHSMTQGLLDGGLACFCKTPPATLTSLTSEHDSRVSSLGDVFCNLKSSAPLGRTLVSN